MTPGRAPPCPSISVVIPTCDRPQLVRAAIDSAVGQTSAASEIIVIDNGTGAAGLESAGLVRIVRTEPRIGASAARNLGASMAHGDYLAFLDDDDTWDRDYLRLMSRAIALDGPDCLIGRKDVMRNGRQVSYKCVRGMDRLMPQLLYCNPGVGGQNMVFLREAFTRIGGFDETLSTSEDRSLTLEFIQRGGRISFVPEAVAILDRSSPLRLSKGRQEFSGKWAFFLKHREQMPRHIRLRALARILGLRNGLLPQSSRVLLEGLANAHHALPHFLLDLTEARFAASLARQVR